MISKLPSDTLDIQCSFSLILKAELQPTSPQEKPAKRKEEPSVIPLMRSLRDVDLFFFSYETISVTPNKVILYRANFLHRTTQECVFYYVSQVIVDERGCTTIDQETELQSSGKLRHTET